MSEQPDRAQHLDLRASDADRERVAKVLNDALTEGRITIAELDERLHKAYAAKTLGELAPLTQDLPMTASHGTPMPTQPSVPSSRIGGEPGGPATAFALMSGFRRDGAWVLPAHYTAIAVLGGGELDLREVRFSQAQCTIQAFAFMGGVEIIVPDDITVRVSGFAFMGGFEHRNLEGPPGAPVLHVTGFAMMGGVEVRRSRPRDRERRELEDRRWQDRRDRLDERRERHERRPEDRRDRD